MLAVLVVLFFLVRVLDVNAWRFETWVIWTVGWTQSWPRGPVPALSTVLWAQNNCVPGHFLVHDPSVWHVCFFRWLMQHWTELHGGFINFNSGSDYFCHVYDPALLSELKQVPRWGFKTPSHPGVLEQMFHSRLAAALKPAAVQESLQTHSFMRLLIDDEEQN